MPSRSFSAQPSISDAALFIDVSFPSPSTVYSPSAMSSMMTERNA
jgi:hypothetical protein